MPRPRSKKEKPSQSPSPKALRTLSTMAFEAQSFYLSEERVRKYWRSDPCLAAKQGLDDLSNSEQGYDTLAWIREHLLFTDLVRNEANPGFAELGAISAVACEAANYLELTESEIKQQIKSLLELRAALKCVMGVMRIDLLSKSTRDELYQRWSQLAWLDAMGSTRGKLRDRYFLYQLFEYFKLSVQDAPAASVFTRIFAALSGRDNLENVGREVRRHFETFNARSTQKRAR